MSVALLALGTLASPRAFAAQLLTRVSVGDRIQGAGTSSNPVLSANGRVVAFSSSAGNLVAGDTNSNRDIFVRNLKTGETTRVFVSSDGAEGNGQSLQSSLSSNARLVAFLSAASNLVPGDTNGEYDIFVSKFK